MDCTSEWFCASHLEICLPDLSVQCTEGLIAAQSLCGFYVRSYNKKMSLGVLITNRPVQSWYSYFSNSIISSNTMQIAAIRVLNNAQWIPTEEVLGISSLLNVSKMFWQWKPHIFQRTLKTTFEIALLKVILTPECSQ